MDEKRNIDKLFEQALKGYKPKAPVHAWDRLDQDLTRLARKKKLIYFRLAAASFALLLAFGAGYFIANYTIQNKIAESPVNSVENQIANTDGQEINKENSDDVAVPNDPKISAESDGGDAQPIPNIITKSESNQFASVEQEKSITRESSFLTNSASPENKTSNPSIMANVIPPIDYLSVKDFHSESAINSIALRNKKVPKVVTPEIDFNEINRIEYGYTYPDSEKKKTINYKWSVGAQFAPTYSYRDISTDYSSGNASSISEEKNFNNVEEAMSSYAGGVNVDFHVTSRWVLQSGLYISQIGQVNNDALQFVQNNNDYILYAINTSTGPINVVYEKVPDDVKKIVSPKDTIESINLSNISIRQQFELFEIPLMVKYKLLNKKLSVNLAGGLSPAYLLNDKTFLEVGNEKHDIGDASNLNSVIINSSLGVGVEYLFTRKFSFSFEPTFKYSMSPINKNSQFYYHPYYFSLFTGIKYSF